RIPPAPSQRLTRPSPRSPARSHPVTGTLVWFTVLAAPAGPAAAQPATPAEMVIALNVRPMPAPRPALRYLLLPELGEMTPGNPIPGYLRCMLDQDFSADQ